MHETDDNRSRNPKTLGVAAVAIAACGLAGYGLSPWVRTSPTEELPENISRHLLVTSRVDENGELMNGAWLAKDPKDQEWIDAAQSIYITLIRTQLPLGPGARLILKEQIHSTVEGLKKNAATSADSSAVNRISEIGEWLEENENVNHRLSLPTEFTHNRAIADSLDRRTKSFRYTDPESLLQIARSSESSLDEISYFSWPEKQ